MNQWEVFSHKLFCTFLYPIQRVDWGNSHPMSLLYPEFFGQTGTHIKPCYHGWCQAKKFSKFVPPDSLKKCTPWLPVIEFFCQISFKLIKLLLQKDFFLDDIQILKIWLVNKLVSTAKQSELKWWMGHVAQREAQEVVETI